MFISLGAVYAGSAAAARWSVEPAVEARATWTDNVALENPAREDVLVELTPAVRLLGVGRGLRISGTLGAAAVGYLNGTRRDRLLPVVDLAADLEPIERVFSVEAGVVTRRTAEDVFAPQPDGAADLNTARITQYRVAPALRGRFGGEVEFELRSGNSWTDVSGTTTPADGAYLGEHRLRLERTPRRFGWRLELARSDTRFESQSPPLARTDSGRLTLSYGVSEALSFGLRGGYERTNVVVRDNEQAIYGATARWRPTERTDLEASGERRFFGTGWQLRFRHRMPRLAWDVRSGRDVSTFPQAFLTLPPTDNVAALLDAAFTTRFPDEAERRRVVADLIARHGLPASLATQTALFSQQVSLITSNSAAISLIGVRNSFALSVFSTRTEQLPDSIFTLAPTATGNLKQKGAALTVSHQLTPLTALNVTTSHTRARGIGADQGPDSEQDGVRVQVTRQLGARTAGSAGARFLEFRAVAADVVRETAAFVGLNHRF